MFWEKENVTLRLAVTWLLNFLKAHTEAGTLAQWTGAAATFCAVCIALYRDLITTWLRRPTLVPEIRCNKVPYINQMTGAVVYEAYIFRLWVENRGTVRATDVQVFAAKLSRERDGRYEPVRAFLPLNLVWARRTTIMPGISPKMGQHCDIGRISEPGRRPSEDTLTGVSVTNTVFNLSLEVPPSTLAHLLEPGAYQLELHIAAGNCDPVIKTVQFVHGVWFDDEEAMRAEAQMAFVS